MFKYTLLYYEYKKYFAVIVNVVRQRHIETAMNGSSLHNQYSIYTNRHIKIILILPNSELTIAVCIIYNLQSCKGIENMLMVG